MSSKLRVFIVNNIKLSISASFKEAFSIAQKKLSTIGINAKNARKIAPNKVILLETLVK